MSFVRQYKEGDQSTFPWATFGLMTLFYAIGIFTLNLNALNNINSDIAGRDLLLSWVRENLVILPTLEFQWTVFTYHFIHFGFVHYAYVGVLLFYYVPGLERATSKMFILISYLLLAIIPPLMTLPTLYLIEDIFPSLDKYFMEQSHYMGASIGAWGLVGVTTVYSYRRRLFWLDIIVLLILEFFLKIRTGADITSNVVHVLAFVLGLFYGWRLMNIETANRQLGGMHRENKIDQIIVAFILIWAATLTGFFMHELGII